MRMSFLSAVMGVCLATASVGLLGSLRASGVDITGMEARATACSDAVLRRASPVNRAQRREAASLAYDACGSEWGDAAHGVSASMADDPAVIATRDNQRSFTGDLPDGAYRGLLVASRALRETYVRRASAAPSGSGASH